MPTPKSTAKAPTKINRVYREDMTIDSDTFKLEVANYAKNISFDEKNPLMVATPHCHYYHTFDSSGKRMIQCNSVGGHTHDITIEVNDNGDMIGVCGKAISSKSFNDEHTHEVIYLKSDRFKIREFNKDAQQAIANLSKW